jgi:DNA-binding MarR family transcriptional regulator
MEFSENEEKILRFLYMSGEFYRIIQISKETSLTENQVDYATDKLDEKDLVRKKEDETRGDINNAHVYALSTEGKKLVRTEDLEKSKEDENREEIDKLRKELLQLVAKIEDTEEDLEEWSKYSSDWNDAAKARFSNIEKRVDNIEKTLDIINDRLDKLEG